jgi:hypothetical protein
MPTTYSLIASSTVGAGGATSIGFTSIPSIYTDLSLVISIRTSQAGSNFTGSLTFNGSSTSYSGRWLSGNGATATSGTPGSTYIYIGEVNGSSTTSNTFTNINLYIPNYASSNNKSVSIDAVYENNATTAYARLLAGLWSNSSAINSISFNAENYTLVQYSSAYLYGIVKS